jgi:hypothetical protein
VRALDPELVWLAHEHEPWRPAPSNNLRWAWKAGTVLTAFAALTPAANLQQETAATSTRSGASGCACSRLTKHG